MRELWNKGPWLPWEPTNFAEVATKGVSFRSNGKRRTAAENTAERQRLQKIYEDECLAYKEQVKGKKAAWPQLQIELLQHDIEFLQRYKQAATTEEKWHFRINDKGNGYWKKEREGAWLFDPALPWRYHLICDKEEHDTDVFHDLRLSPINQLPANDDLTKSVYIGHCQKRGFHKIGRTIDQPSRFLCHKKKLDTTVEVFDVYHTAIDHEMLEKLLHYYFGHWRVSREESVKSEENVESEESAKSDELFDLSDEHASQFGAVVQTVEDFLVDAEIFRLQGILARFEAERKNKKKQRLA